MNSFRQEALDVLSRHTGLNTEKIDALLERPPKSDLGDFAFPCFQLAKELKKAPPQIAEELGCDYLVYQEVEDLKAAIMEGSDLVDLDMSCFDGRYVTGTVSEEYLAWVEGSQES